MISVVTALRNDDHGKNFKERFLSFVRNTSELFTKYNVQAELICVEWNNPANKPHIWDLLPRERAPSAIPLRFIVVPPEIHKTYANANQIVFFQMIAKNVGIRRAEGEFILATNCDILFSEELVKNLVSYPLADNTYYRANRCDIPADVIRFEHVDEQIAHAQATVMRRLGYVPPYFAAKAGWMKEYIRCKAKVNYFLGRKPYVPVDNDAAGDFTMMSRSAWEKIKGYFELGLYSIYIDELALHAARAIGVEQVVFPPEWCVYHIDHAAGWMNMDTAEKMKFTEMRPAIDWALVHEAKIWMNTHHAVLQVNSENWGLRNVSLYEHRI